MVGVIVAILVSAAVIKGGDTDGTDEFIARQAWLYVAIVAGAYFIGRGSGQVRVARSVHRESRGGRSERSLADASRPGPQGPRPG